MSMVSLVESKSPDSELSVKILVPAPPVRKCSLRLVDHEVSGHLVAARL
ncbi:hypothetical protein [Acidiphilium multivorum]|nr:hypothetical protein [Acidiphilium multivorum]MBS3025601.1 hypothetical protein [Acidiphilium multivorum]